MTERTQTSEELRLAYEALADSPDDAALLLQIGCLHRELNDFRTAELFLLRAIDSDPQSAWARLYLGNVYYSRNQYGLAIHEWETARRLMPTSPCPYWCLADAHAAAGRIELADRYYRQAVELAPDDPQAVRILREWRERVYSDREWLWV
jgi:tetratricopeptide (TPR) repeat protein